MTAPRKLWLAALISAALTPAAHAAGGGAYNGTALCSRPNNTTSYGSGAITKLFGCQSAGNTVPALVTLGGAQAGPNIITGARISTNGTGASTARYQIYLFAGTTLPTLTGLSDQSTYLGPFAVDLVNFIGTLSCSAMAPTSDATPQYFSECSTTNLAGGPGLQFQGSPRATLAAVFEVTAGYVPISGETLVLRLATAPYQ